MESLNTSIGAIVKVEAFEEQEKKLESFKVATEALNMQVKKVKEKGNWKIEEGIGSPEETDETAALRSLTFTIEEEKYETMRDIIPIFTDLNGLELV